MASVVRVLTFKLFNQVDNSDANGARLSLAEKEKGQLSFTQGVFANLVHCFGVAIYNFPYLMKQVGVAGTIAGGNLYSCMLTLNKS